MSDVAIRVEGLGKRFSLIEGGGARYKALRDSIAGLFLPRSGKRKTQINAEFWGLKDISFEIRPGEVTGLIGRNGAGKSTLLKVLSRITEPTEGFADIHGRVGSLLEVGTGFHPELSGRENIFLNGAILGMRNKEIVRKFDEIVSFAEIERFIDSPVKFYSSGMFVRLAFSVAAHLEPEILFVDEVLAVGDAAFQKKCLGKMDDVARSGRTVVLVSHNMGAISELCTHGILLDRGRLVLQGSVEQVVDAYGKRLAEEKSGIQLEDTGGPFAILSIDSSNPGTKVETGTFDINEEIALTLTYRIREPLRGLVLAVQVARNFNNLFYTYDTDHLEAIPTREPGLYTSRLVIPRHLLKAGTYSVRIAAGVPLKLLASYDDILQFNVEELTENTHEKAYRSDRPGHIIAPVQWTIDRLDTQ